MHQPDLRNPWRPDRLDLTAYLTRIGVPERAPSRAALDQVLDAHLRTFTFDNADVLLEQHPGVDLDAVQEKFVRRGRGGYCFEHSTLLGAALEQLGYDAVRRLARVGDPTEGVPNGRTHLVVEVVLDGERLLCDPGFGNGPRRPVPLVDGREDVQEGGRFRATRDPVGAWRLERARPEGWELLHSTDELPVSPADVLMGHHWTSTYPGSHFRHGLMVTKLLPGRHVTVTHEALTVRVPGEPTEHRPLADGELAVQLERIGAGLTAEEISRLVARAAAFAAA